MTDERLDLIDALLYADAFDCAVTLEELRRYARRPVERDELRRRLREDPELRRLVAARDGLYCLADRQALLDERPAKIARSRVLQRRALRIARVLRHAPFVRGFALTGSVAPDGAAEGADVDVLVIVAPARIGTVFALLATVSRLVGRKRFCPNYYVSEERLAMTPHSLYVARELAQARPLVGDGHALVDANPWISELLPNAVSLPDGEQPLAPGARVQRLLELPFRGRLGYAVERRARRLARTRLGVHYAGYRHDVPREVVDGLEAGAALRFHGRFPDGSLLERYERRRAELAAQLDRETPRQRVRT